MCLHSQYHHSLTSNVPFSDGISHRTSLRLTDLRPLTMQSTQHSTNGNGFFFFGTFQLKLLGKLLCYFFECILRLAFVLCIIVITNYFCTLTIYMHSVCSRLCKTDVAEMTNTNIKITYENISYCLCSR